MIEAAQSATADQDEPRSLAQAGTAISAAERVLQAAKMSVRRKVAEAGGLDGCQHAAHGLSWLATYVEALRQLHNWGRRLTETGAFGELEQALLALGMAEYAAQIAGGIPMSQGETARLRDMDVDAAEVRRFEDSTADLIADGTSDGLKRRLAELIAALPPGELAGNSGLDETHAAIQEQMRRFSEAEVAPYAQEWHLANAYIPMEVIGKLGELGVFGITLPEAYGGLGLGKEAM